MRRTYLISLICFFILSSCALVSTAPDRTIDEAMLNFLPYLNQKVSGYHDAHSMSSLDIETYKSIINERCSPLPSCKRDAESMLNAYDIKVRIIDGMFSVLLCDKDGVIKKIEDFSCNEQKVEIPSFQSDQKIQCNFEENWKDKIAPYCPGIK
ncbi:MAG: hypothetical protein AB1306_08605 [Nitrospirota bacterium]